jgi:hypothetical protein
MKYFLSFLPLFFTFCAFAQTNTNYSLLVNKWTEAKVDSVGQVVQADAGLGGWSSLTITSNKTVVYAGSFDCGFGQSREGKWKLNSKKNTLTFRFTKKIGFMNVPGTEKIYEKEVYRIEKLTGEALVLKDLSRNKIKAFITSEQNK